MMRSILTVVLLSVFVAGCAAIKPAELSPPVLVWRGDSGIRLEDVATPDGFKISPAEAIGGILAEMELKEWAIPYLFADSTYYHFGFADKRKAFPSSPEDDANRIDGRTAKWIRKKGSPNQ